MERAVHQCLAEIYVPNDMAIRRIDLPIFKVPVAEFVKNEVEKQSLDRANLDKYRNLTNEAIFGHDTKTED